MKHIFLNLKRFDVPKEYGGVNAIAAVKDWGSYIVEQTQKGLMEYGTEDVEFAMFFPEAHILTAAGTLCEGSPVKVGCQGVFRQDTAVVEAFGNAIVTLKHEVKYCKVCHNISDTETCCICSSPQRDASVVCVVENIRDVMAVEATQQFRGLYHVLGGVISPMDGIGPGDLQIESLVQRVSAGGINEVILALSTTMEGDTTNFYIYRKLEKLGVKLSVIARGISIGDELEYTDEVTLGRSIVNRTPFSGTA